MSKRELTVESYGQFSLDRIWAEEGGKKIRKVFPAKFFWPVCTAKSLHLALQLVVLTVKGTVVNKFFSFLKTSNKGRGGSALLNGKNGLHRSIPSFAMISYHRYVLPFC